MSRILDEIKLDLKFIGSHTLQPRWYKLLKVFILLGGLVCLAAACSTPVGPAAENPTAPMQTPGSAPTPAPANLEAFYVAPEGSDESGDGSAARPWGSITYALDCVPDGSLILVRPGEYQGRIRIRGDFERGVTVRSEVPYQARLRAQEAVLTIYEARGISIEGFDIAHSGPGAEPIVVHIQDNLGDEPGGQEVTSRITLRDNIIHDSYNNDLLKINNGAEQITITGNLFYNQGDSDEHIDINSVRDVVIEDNVFMSDFAGSGRAVSGEASSDIVVKDSNGEDDGLLGSENITIRRNIFLHYEGSPGANYILLGEDGNSYYEARNVLIENNLFLGVPGMPMRAPFGCKGVTDAVFQFNTISGDLSASGYAMRLNLEGDNRVNSRITLVNNIWSDPTGSMEHFAVAPAGESQDISLLNNLYWNGGAALPQDAGEAVSLLLDPSPLFADPLLADPGSLTLPRWEPDSARFADGSASIRQVFETLVHAWAVPGQGSPALDAADPGWTSIEDILGSPRPQGSAADLGAVEMPEE